MIISVKLDKLINRPKSKFNVDSESDKSGEIDEFSPANFCKCFFFEYLALDQDSTD